MLEEAGETDAMRTNRVHLIVFTFTPLIFAGIMWAIDTGDHDFVDVSDYCLGEGCAILANATNLRNADLDTICFLNDCVRYVEDQC